MITSGGTLSEIGAVIGIFVLLLGAAVCSMLIYPYLKPAHRDDGTHRVISRVSNIFALMTSLVLGLMITSSRTAFDGINQNVHDLASRIILLDQTLDEYGADTASASRRLANYAHLATRSIQLSGTNAHLTDPGARNARAALGRDLRSLRPTNQDQQSLRNEAQDQLRQIEETRWQILEQTRDVATGSPFFYMLVAWLLVIFVGFGYGAPRNAFVVLTFASSAGLIAGTLFLVMDMQRPFSGPIRVSVAPLERSIVELRN